MCLDCNDSLQVNIPESTPGQDGQSAYVYIASADDSTGLNFNYPQDPTQRYVAIINTTSPISSPQASDFTGKWRLLTGQNGSNGVNGLNGSNGLDAGIPFNFVNYGLSTDPGSTNISLNGTSVPLTSVINVSYTDKSSVNVQGFITALNTSTSSTKAIIKLTKANAISSFGLFALTSVVDTGTYYQLQVTYLAGSNTPFTAGNTVYLAPFETGLKGDTGASGPAGAFIIGTIGAGTQAYPSPAVYGSAWRATGNGTISDSGAGLANVRRFYTNDVIYCHTDTSTSDGSKFFIWHGFPRAFYPGAGTDSLVQNTSLGGTASGANSIASKGSSVTADNSTSFGRASNISGQDWFDSGVNNTSASKRGMTLGYQNTVGTGCDYTTVGGTGNTIGDNSEACTVFGRQNTVGTSCILTTIAGDFNTVENSVQYTQINGTGVRAYISNAIYQGAGTWSTGGTRGLKQTIKFPLQGELAGSSATGTLATMKSGGTSTFTLPTKSVWGIRGKVFSVITSGANMGQLAEWEFSGQVTNLAGTCALKGNIVCLDDTGTATTISALNTALDNRLADGSNDSILKITASSNTISFSVVGCTGVSDPTYWSGDIEVVQLGWF